MFTLRVPYIGTAGELKTKTTQHSVNKPGRSEFSRISLLCRTIGICLPELRKIAMFCNIEKDAVITPKDVDTIYEVRRIPEEGLDDLIVHRSISRPVAEPARMGCMVQKISIPR